MWAAIKPHIRFRQDFDIAQDLQSDDPRKRSIVETFIPPAVQALLIQLRGSGVEDCDGFTMYGACLLLALGVPVSMCTVSAERSTPGLFSHVYLVAYWNGMRIPMDLSHGPCPGWECPNLGRVREWVVSGDTIRPSMFVPLLLVAAAGGYLIWKGNAVRVLNSTRGTSLGDQIEIAETLERRRTGLLGREVILPGEGLWMKPASGVHTFGMKFPIDVLFLDADRFIVGIMPDMQPEDSSGRFPYCKVDSVLELPAGTVHATGTREGDGLDLHIEKQADMLSLGMVLAGCVFIFALLVAHA